MNSCIKCGCQEAFPSLPPCPVPAACPNPQPCAEVFDAQCIVFTLPDIECGNDVVVAQDSTIAETISSIVDYFCGKIDTINVHLTNIDAQITTINNRLVNLQKEITATYVLTDADNDYTIFINNDVTAISISLGAITIPNFCVGFVQEGSADVTFVGVTNPVGLKLKGQGYQAFIERKLSTATYYLLGNTKA